MPKLEADLWQLPRLLRYGLIAADTTPALWQHRETTAEGGPRTVLHSRSRCMRQPADERPGAPVTDTAAELATKLDSPLLRVCGCLDDNRDVFGLLANRRVLNAWWWLNNADVLDLAGDSVPAAQHVGSLRRCLVLARTPDRDPAREWGELAPAVTARAAELAELEAHLAASADYRDQAAETAYRGLRAWQDTWRQAGRGSDATTDRAPDKDLRLLRVLGNQRPPARVADALGSLVWAKPVHSGLGRPHRQQGLGLAADWATTDRPIYTIAAVYAFALPGAETVPLAPGHHRRADVEEAMSTLRPSRDGVRYEHLPQMVDALVAARS